MASHHKVLITKCRFCFKNIDHSSDRGSPRILCNNRCKQADKNLRNKLNKRYKWITESWHNLFIQLAQIEVMPTCNICLDKVDEVHKDGKLEMCTPCYNRVLDARKK